VSFDIWLRESYTDALEVIRGNEIVWERYMNGMTANQPHQMMSVTKSFTGLLGLMAIEDGLLVEDDPVPNGCRSWRLRGLLALQVMVRLPIWSTR